MINMTNNKKSVIYFVVDCGFLIRILLFCPYILNSKCILIYINLLIRVNINVNNEKYIIIDDNDLLFAYNDLLLR